MKLGSAHAPRLGLELCTLGRMGCLPLGPALLRDLSKYSFQSPFHNVGCLRTGSQAARCAACCPFCPLLLAPSGLAAQNRRWAAVLAVDLHVPPLVRLQACEASMCVCLGSHATLAMARCPPMRGAPASSRAGKFHGCFCSCRAWVYDPVGHERARSARDKMVRVQLCNIDRMQPTP